MKSLRKITAWAMALAIASTAAAMTTAYAEGEEAPTELLTEAPTDAPTELLTEAPTEVITEAPTEIVTIPTTPAVTGDVSGTVMGIEIRISGNNIYMKDTSTGTSVNFENGKATVDGTVISDIQLADENLTAEEMQLIMRAAEVVGNISITEIVLTDNVTDVNINLFDASEVENCTKITFGKNIKTISDDIFGNFTATPTVYGYAGTAAETFAKNKGLTFSALNQASTTAAPATTTKKTTTVKTTAKTSASSTAKKSDSPKTGDAGTVTGVLAIAAAAGVLSMKKKKHE